MAMRLHASFLLAILTTGAESDLERVIAPPGRAHAAFAANPARRFDFWIGEWSVNLRILQEDLQFKDSVASRAHIYSILDGKAILELWDSKPIKGYSLRYRDPTKGKWVLWLSWPGPNRSGTSSLQGGFRHGRGDFVSRRTDAAGQETIQRYSFNDITPFSLRWDDSTSKDGGRTWSKNWIMEWTRVAVDPVWPIADDDVPTYDDGSRCDVGEYRPYEAIAGHWEAGGRRLDAYRVLDGCAVIAFLEAGDRQEFLYVGYLSRTGRWETQVLDGKPGTGLVRYSSDHGWETVTSAGGEDVTWSVDGDRLTYSRGDATITFRGK